MRRQYSQNIEKRLDCIQHGCHTESTQKKRKFSRFIFIFDIILIIIIFFYFYNNKEEKTVSSGSLTHNGVLYRFSGSIHEESCIFIASLSGTGSRQTVKFNGNVGTLSIYYKENRIVQKNIEGKRTLVSIKPDTVENFFITIPFSVIHQSLADYAEQENRDALYALLFGSSRDLKASFRFNTDDSVTVETIIPFKGN